MVRGIKRIYCRAEPKLIGTSRKAQWRQKQGKEKVNDSFFFKFQETPESHKVLTLQNCYNLVYWPFIGQGMPIKY